LAVASERRSVVLPEIPTMAEAGFPGVETGTWYGIVAPPRTPASIVSAVHTGILRALQSPDLKARLVAQGVDVVGSSPDQFQKFIIAEIAKWSRVVKQAGVRAE
jgi:tripartite-type tricarboxylate transporter receptor subunit TctC